MITVKQMKKYLASLQKEADNLEIKYDNGFDYEEIRAIKPKYSPDLRKPEPLFLAIL